MSITAPAAPTLRLSIGVTGHRAGNAAFATNRIAIEAALAEVLDVIQAAAATTTASVRLHCLLSDGADHLAARSGLARDWELVAPLPFGRNLNVAINAAPASIADAKALIAGEDSADLATHERAQIIRELCAKARCFELAERDDLLTRLYLDKLGAPADLVAAQAFAARCSARVALAGRLLIEQSDIMIGIWDGVSRAFVGGTGHTISEALEHGAPVVWIDARSPADWRILRAPEALATEAAPDPAARRAELHRLIREALFPDKDDAFASFARENWRSKSSRWWTGYRRVEALFGGTGRPFRSLAQRYEPPDAIAKGSGAAMLAALRGVPDHDPDIAARIETDVLPRFAWADGISARLSDSYRGGMTVNFLLSSLAVVVGIS